MSRFPSATISILAARVFQTWPLAKGRSVLVSIFIRPLDGQKPGFVQSACTFLIILSGPFAPLAGVLKGVFRALGNREELLNDFIEALFHEVCKGKALVQCIRTAQVEDLVREACDREFDLIVPVPHNLVPEASPPTPMGFIVEALRSIRAIKAQWPTPIVTIVAPEERSKYEPLLLEAGTDCVLELPFEGDQLTSAVSRLLLLPARLEHLQSRRWFFAGVLMRGLRRLAQA